MSKETYLKGEERIKAIQIIKTGLGLRMNTKEILDRLKKNGIEISERTLRRMKLEIYQSAGGTISEIFQNQVGGTIFDEILSFEEMERRCWELYYSTTVQSEKLRTISQMRLISQDKMKLLHHFPLGYRHESIDYTKRNDLKEIEEEGEPPTNLS